MFSYDDGGRIPPKEQDWIFDVAVLKQILFSCKVKDDVVRVSMDDVNCFLRLGYQREEPSVVG